MHRVSAIFFLAFAAHATAAAPAAPSNLDQLTLRCRVTAMTPEVPVRIVWRYGGEGQGGAVIEGEFTRLRRQGPAVPKELLAIGSDGVKPEKIDDLLGDVLKKDGKAKPTQVTVEGKSYEYVYLQRNAWSPPLAISQIAPGRSRPGVITVTLLPATGTPVDQLREVMMEFELSYRGKVLKTFSEAGPMGATAGIALGLRSLRDGVEPTDPGFLNEVCGLAEYSSRRASELEALPWAQRPTPRKYAIITDCSGYGTGAGRGVRTTNLRVMENEFRTLRQLGVNGLRSAPASVIEMANRHEGFAAQFTRAIISRSMGYPVPNVDRDEKTGWVTSAPEGAGDPYFPGTQDRARPQIEETVDRMLQFRGFDEVWGLTHDEIGCIFDLAPEGKKVAYLSPYCIEAFRNFLKQQGVTPADCGARTWEEVDPWTSTGPRPLDWQQTLAQQKEAVYQKAIGGKTPPKGEATTEADDVLDDLARPPQPAKGAPGATKAPTSRVPPRAEALLQYYSALFLNHASATAFTPLRDALAAANTRRQTALTKANAGSDAAHQPVILSYALQGQTFLRRHSLDFFEFYRHADNAFVYETSHTNRLTQIFDSYICDIGRILTETEKTRFGIYVKPHRGSGNQRAMSFAARGGTMLYWYTYGPAWFKGDSFSENKELLENASRFSRILARAEDVMYGARWEYQPVVAIVKPRTTTVLGGRIDDALWTYAALAHAHVPVDPIDEHMIETMDLSRYQAIYVGGEYIRRASATKLAEWVKRGGSLYTADQGMSFDEAREPLLDVLGPVFGVQARGAWEAWDTAHPAPGGATLTATGEYAGDFTPTARETLQLAPGAEAIVRFADGHPAVVRHRFGQGTAQLVAFPAAVEYGRRLARSTPEAPLDMERNADPAWRHYIVGPALACAHPPVEVSHANVEAILLRHPQTNRRAIPLINWAHAQAAESRLRPLSLENVIITLTSKEPVKKVSSAWLDRELPIERNGDRLKITLSQLADCDVLLLE